MVLFNTKVIRLFAVFMGWMVTSFLCHECGKSFLEISQANKTYTEHFGKPICRFLYALILTTIQCLTCFLSVTKIPLNDSSVPLVLRVTHVLTTLATNYSLAYIEAASTLAIKLMEPVTMVMANRIFFKTTVSMVTLISLPIIILGALIFSVRSIVDTTESMGISLAFISNIILTARNVVIKSIHLSAKSGSSPVILRRKWQISVLLASQVVIVVTTYVLERQSVIPVTTTLAVGFVLTSGTFHVAYSYISTNVVLKVMNIVSHSVANIFKRLLVVLLLYLVGRRQASVWNFSGLVLAFLGLYIYVQGKKSETANEDIETDGERMQSIRPKKAVQLTFTFFMGVALIVSLTQVCPNSFYSSRQDITLGGNTHHFLFKELNFLNSFATASGAIIPDRNTSEFLSWHLVDHPEETDARAKTLSENVDIITESQRVLMNLLFDLIGPARHVMLMEIAVYQNKGDPAISVGEFLLLRKMKKTIVYYCETYSCLKANNLQRAVEISKNYTTDELVVLMQGGGNMVGYFSFDLIRDKIIKTFHDRKIIILSQSIWLKPNSGGYLKIASTIYSNNSNLVLFLRDRQSLAIAKENFKGIKHILAPDMAFGIGLVPRQMAPLYDIIWLKRRDSESTLYTLPTFPAGVSVHVSDWINEWKSNKGATDLESCFLIAQAGFQFLQRGRVVVTDRLHGHILSTLMGIPHVIIDNPPYFKLSSFGKSWTDGLSNVIRVDNGSLALTAALKLLKQFDAVLPQIGPINVEKFSMRK